MRNKFICAYCTKPTGKFLSKGDFHLQAIDVTDSSTSSQMKIEIGYECKILNRHRIFGKSQ